MKSGPARIPGRVRLVTLPEESQATPSQEEQQSVGDVHESSSCEGSEPILRLNWRSASLSVGWQDSETKKRKKKGRDKVLSGMEKQNSIFVGMMRF